MLIINIYLHTYKIRLNFCKEVQNLLPTGSWKYVIEFMFLHYHYVWITRLASTSKKIITPTIVNTHNFDEMQQKKLTLVTKYLSIYN